MLKPILIFQITNGIIGCLKIFEEPLMLFGDYKGGVNSAAQTMNMKFLDTAFKAGQSGYGAAIGYLMFVIILIFYDGLFPNCQQRGDLKNAVKEKQFVF